MRAGARYTVHKTPAKSSDIAWWSHGEGVPAPLELVRAPVGTNPRPTGRYNLAVIGGGIAGAGAALAAARLGAKVALLDKHQRNPSAAGLVASLIGAARAMHEARQACRAGDAQPDLAVDLSRLWAAAATNEPRSNPEAAARIAQSGIDVFAGAARFLNPDTLEIAGTRIEFARALVATGSIAAVPAIEGLESAGYVTPDTLGTLSAVPRRLVVIGGGPRGCELAQAFARLGVEVTLVERGARLLQSVDERAAAIVAGALESERVRILTGCEVVQAEVVDDGAQRRVHYERGLETGTLDCDQIVVAIGRDPNLSGLGLDAAGIEFDRFGVRVDDFLRTSNRKVFAAGDVCSTQQFAHTALALGQLAAQNALFWRRKRASSLLLPWYVRTDPEIAHIGPVLEDAPTPKCREHWLHSGGSAAGAGVSAGCPGFLRAHCRGRAGTIVGATVVSFDASQVIFDVLLAMQSRTTLRSLASMPLPTASRSLSLKRLADDFARQALRPSMMSWIERFLRWQRA